MTFPISVSFEVEVAPMAFDKLIVNCIRLEQHIKADGLYGILVEFRHGRKKMILALADMEIDEDNENSTLIALYHDWFWTHR